LSQKFENSVNIILVANNNPSSNPVTPISRIGWKTAEAIVGAMEIRCFFRFRHYLKKSHKMQGSIIFCHEICHGKGLKGKGFF